MRFLSPLTQIKAHPFNPPHPPLETQREANMDIELAKQTLLARRAELTAHLHEVEDQLDEPPSKDWEDRSAERQGDEVLEALGAQELAEVRQIDAALARVEAGTYGECVKCGGEIATARLQLLPATPLCAGCAK
jgi:RNA polymerase-binding transcription factor DksA